MLTEQGQITTTGAMVMNDKSMVRAMQFASSGPWYVFLCTGTGRILLLFI
jgi:hypothetical protein